jgi:hypothetical protein
MLYKNIFGFNLNLIKSALVIGIYDIFGTVLLIVMEIEFFSQSTFITLINSDVCASEA